MVTVGPGDTLNTAYGRMRANDVSQLPVLDDNDSIIGLLDEEDLLLAVHQAPNVCGSVSLHMTSKLDIIDPSMDIESLFPIFKSGKVAIVQQDSPFRTDYQS